MRPVKQTVFGGVYNSVSAAAALYARDDAWQRVRNEVRNKLLMQLLFVKEGVCTQMKWPR